MDAADVDTIADILSDYFYPEDHFYAELLNRLEQRENIMISDAVTNSQIKSHQRYLAALDGIIKEH